MRTTHDNSAATPTEVDGDEVVVYSDKSDDGGEEISKQKVKKKTEGQS